MWILWGETRMQRKLGGEERKLQGLEKWEKKNLATGEPFPPGEKKTTVV